MFYRCPMVPRYRLNFAFYAVVSQFLSGIGNSRDPIQTEGDV